SAVVNVTATVGLVCVSGVTLSSYTVGGGGTGATGTVTLTAPAGAGGVIVSLSSNNLNVLVGTQVTIPAGQISANFPISTLPVVANTPGTISASAGGCTSSVSLTVQAPSLLALIVAPASITGGLSATGTVTLTAPVASAGAIVNLSSNNALVWVPSSVI